jgi:hypothetical protein
VSPLRPFGVLGVGTEEAELTGYRVRLRVVEEYDIVVRPQAA